MFALLGLIGAAAAAVFMIDFGGDEDTDHASAVADDDAADTDEPRVPLDQFVSDDDTVIFAGEGNDELRSGAGNDYLHGRDGDDTITSAGGNDTLQGGRGNDHLDAGEGDDVLNGHTGDDILIGGDGDDRLNGGEGNDTLEGGDGDDWLLGSFGDDLMSGGAGADTLHGGDGNDRLWDQGDDVRDYLNGGDGDDILQGWNGDHLHGGTGADSFVLTPGMTVLIADFDPAEDVVEITYETVPPALDSIRTDEGVALLADGEAVAVLQGVETLDLDQIRLIAV